MYITLIGSLVILIKKRISRQIIQRIPKSNILPQPTNNPVRPSIEINTEPNLNVTYNHSPLFKLNNSKYNKNIIGFIGLFIIGMLAYIMFGVNILIRQGWMKELHGSMDLFVHYCIWPVVLPTIYFMRNPKLLKSVLQDHNLM